VNRYQKIADAAKASTVPEDLEVIRADEIKIEAPDWMWPGRFARGKLGLLGGNPERGKGLILADIFSRITRGAPWPCNEGKAEIGDCILLQQEDSLKDTVGPRLIAAGVDRSRLRILNMVKKADGSSSRLLNIRDDMLMVEKVLEELNDPQILAIDPIGAYLPKINAGAGNEVRSALAPLVDLLERFHLAGVAVIHFNKKTDVDNALARISDSVAFGAVARHCFVVTEDPENERRLLVKAKNNLAPDIKALSYTIQETYAGTDHRDGREVRAPRVIWGTDHVEISSTQAMRAENGGKAAGNPRKEASDFILTTLADSGPMSADDLFAAAKDEGISEATFKRARNALRDDKKISRDKQGLKGPWVWKLGDGKDVDEF
jgi:putative DNA primase/helicase